MPFAGSIGPVISNLRKKVAWAAGFFIAGLAVSAAIDWTAHTFFLLYEPLWAAGGLLAGSLTWWVLRYGFWF
jgi:hypothetical protein